jgi:hypothetical protein
MLPPPALALRHGDQVNSPLPTERAPVRRSSLLLASPPTDSGAATPTDAELLRPLRVPPRRTALFRLLSWIDRIIILALSLWLAPPARASLGGERPWMGSGAVGGAPISAIAAAIYCALRVLTVSSVVVEAARDASRAHRASVASLAAQLSAAATIAGVARGGGGGAAGAGHAGAGRHRRSAIVVPRSLSVL